MQWIFGVGHRLAQFVFSELYRALVTLNRIVSEVLVNTRVKIILCKKYLGKNGVVEKKCFHHLDVHSLSPVSDIDVMHVIFIYIYISCDFIAWWRHQMETLTALLAVCAGNSPVTGEFPRQGQWREALVFSLICAWLNGWVNNREAGDLGRHRAHYDVTVMDQLIRH